MKTTHSPRKSTLYALWDQLSVNPTFMTIGISVLIIIIGFVMLTVSARLNQVREEDLANAKEQYGVAIVIKRLPINNKGTTNKLIGPLSIEYNNLIGSIDGHQVTLETRSLEKIAFTEVGDKVTVSYRIGKSGSYYVDDWTPPTRKTLLPVRR